MDKKESRSCTDCKFYKWYRPEGFLCLNKNSDKKALSSAGGFHAIICKFFSKK